MKITIWNTTKFVEVDGIRCRVWEGKTESGIQVQCLVPRIAARASEDLREFERELQEQRAPSPEFNAFPLRMIL